MLFQTCWRHNLKSVLLIIVSVLLVAYPLIVFFGLQHFEARYIGIIILCALSLRLFVIRQSAKWEQLKTLLPVTLAGVCLCLFIVIFNSPTLVKLNPVLISTVMLFMFSSTLIKPPSMIERFARISDSNLPPEAIPYTKNVTKVWCGFFFCNGLIAAYTIWFCSIEIWTLYNGLISYMIMGIIFAAEYLIRLKKKREHIEATHG